MPRADAFADALAVLDAHYQAMPPVAAMGLAIGGFDGTRLRLHAPLARHVNDKGCAFGGSLASLMTLAGWGLVALRLHEDGIEAEVFVADSEVRYLKPLFADLAAEAELAADVDWNDVLADLRGRGRARIGLVARVRLPDGGVAAEARAGFVAIAKG
ncbi:MAG TPA: YiiD C-terminal domain-containing protein [Xanthomonadaceae bacterium]|nr:YiiD C-terminal domain-containing protein [Xanthomonadaceae bacterium]